MVIRVQASMRWLAIVWVAAIPIVSIAPPPVAGGDAGVRLMSANRGIGVRLPRDWHLIGRGVGPQTNRPVRIKPAVMASFVVSFARHP